MHPEACIFCAIVAGTAERSLVAEEKDALAIMNLVQNPAVPGHVLVIPRRHVRDIYTLDAATAGAVFDLAARVARAVKVSMAAEGMTLIQNNEPAGGQDVFHLHVHVIPRRHGDGSAALALRRPPGRAELDRLAALIRAEFDAHR